MNSVKFLSQIKRYSDNTSGYITNFNGTQQVIGPSVSTTITMPVKSSNSTVLYDYTTNANAIRVKRSGWYNITFNTWCTATAGSPINRGISIVKNAGATSLIETTGHQTSAVNVEFACCMNGVAYLTEGEYVYVRFYSQSTTNQVGETGGPMGRMPTLTLEFIEN
jgi:hypothetical protein